MKATKAVFGIPAIKLGLAGRVCASWILPLWLLALASTGHAQFTCTTNDGVLTITDYSGPGGALAIPDMIGGLPVTSIGAEAFEGCTGLTEVTIGSSVTNIGDSAFFACTNLASVTISNSVGSIEGDAFADCTGLTGVMLGNRVTSLGSSAFFRCSELITVTIPDSVTNIGDYAFSGCNSLRRVYFQGNAPTLGVQVFDDPQAIGYYLAGSTGWGTVAGLRALLWDPVSQAAYTNTNGSITITGYAGAGGALAIPDAIDGLPVTAIGAEAFDGFDRWTGLIDVTIGGSVTNIGDYAFYACTTLTSVTIPNSVTRIGNEAFSGCTNLAGVTIPNSVGSIGGGTFWGCTGLIDVTIGSGVTNMGDEAFYACTSLTSVTIPNRVTNIGYWAFRDCSHLVSVVISNGVGSIGGGAFSDCTGLTNVMMPNSVTSIGDDGFDGCTNVVSVTIPNSVTNIGDRAFGNCYSLSRVFFQGNAPTLGLQVFSADQRAVGYYLAGTTGWGTFAALPALLWDPLSQAAYTISNGSVTIAGYAGSGGSLTIPDTINGLPVTGIAAAPFDSYASLTNVVIPGSVTSIGDYLFSDCPRLASVTIPSSVTSIGSGTFSDCTSLTSVAIPYSVTSIGSGAFSDCTRLTSVTIPDRVTSIGSGAFSGCTSLTSVRIPNSVTNIGASAFAWCNRLAAITVDALNPVYSSVAGVLFDKRQTVLLQFPAGKGVSYTIPGSVISIGAAAFACSTLAGSALISVTIPGSVSSIEDVAFSGCYSLTGVFCQGNAPSPGSDLFAYTYEPTVYYAAGTAGWGPTFAGRPTALWNPQNPFDCATNNGAICIAGYTGPGGAVAIPGTIGGLPVTSIGGNAFVDVQSLVSITIPGSVTNLGSSAFEYCLALTGVYFQGNAPAADSTAFGLDNTATVYYLPGTTGWGATFAGVPTAPWTLEVQTGDASFGLQTNQFSFNINWASGMAVVVEATTDLANPIWSALATNTLTGGSAFFSDPQWTNYPARFYRLRWQ